MTFVKRMHRNPPGFKPARNPLSRPGFQNTRFRARPGKTAVGGAAIAER